MLGSAKVLSSGQLTLTKWSTSSPAKGELEVEPLDFLWMRYEDDLSSLLLIKFPSPGDSLVLTTILCTDRSKAYRLSQCYEVQVIGRCLWNACHFCWHKNHSSLLKEHHKNLFWSQIWVTMAWDSDSGYPKFHDSTCRVMAFYSNRTKKSLSIKLSNILVRTSNGWVTKKQRNITHRPKRLPHSIFSLWLLIGN